MLQTLPLVLFIVMTELSIGAFTVLFVLDWRKEVKRSFLITYGLIYVVLTGLTYLFQQNFSTPDLLNSFPQLDKGYTVCDGNDLSASRAHGPGWSVYYCQFLCGRPRTGWGDDGDVAWALVPGDTGAF
jgi:hypothetical protein